VRIQHSGSLGTKQKPEASRRRLYMVDIMLTSMSAVDLDGKCYGNGFLYAPGEFGH